MERSLVKNIILLIVLSIGLGQSMIMLLQWLNVIASNNQLCTVTGFFNNPGPMGCLQSCSFAASLSWTFRHIEKRDKSILFSYILTAIFAFAIAASKSRTALVAAIVSISHLNPIKKRLYPVFIPIFIAITLGSVSSIYGRLLVWIVSIGIVLESPLTGYGAGAFQRFYMLKQAEFFHNYPNSNLAKYAEDVYYPFNEILHLSIDFGVVASIIYIVLIMVTIMYAKKEDSILLVSMTIISLFSYPLYKYVFVVLLILAFALNLEIYNKAAYGLVGVTLLFSLNVFNNDNGCYPNSKLCIQKGYECLSEEKYEEAREYFYLAREMTPNRIKPVYGLWETAVKIGNDSLAVIYANEALNIDMKYQSSEMIIYRKTMTEYLNKEQEL